MSKDRRPNANDVDESLAEAALPVFDGTDGRHLWDPRSRWDDDSRRAQTTEGVFIALLLLTSISFLALVGVGWLRWLLTRVGVPAELGAAADHYSQLAAGGLLGGTVYGGKWLYHAVARGLWHEDRRTWRYLSPLISVGTTIGVGMVIEGGLYRPSGHAIESAPGIVGVGFLIGYFSDRALAKMRELTEVLFGFSEKHNRPASPQVKQGSTRELD